MCVNASNSAKQGQKQVGQSFSGGLDPAQNGGAVDRRGERRADGGKIRPLAVDHLLQVGQHHLRLQRRQLVLEGNGQGLPVHLLAPLQPVQQFPEGRHAAAPWLWTWWQMAIANASAASSGRGMCLRSRYIR